MTPELISTQAKNVKLLILDIDGTLAGKSNTISPSVLSSIAAVQAKGILVAIATGRMYHSAQRFHEMVGSTLPILSYQGAWIQQPGELRLRHTALKAEQAIELLDYFEQPALRKLISVHFYMNDRLYVREMTPDSISYCDRCRTEPTIVPDLRSILTQGELTKVLAINQDSDLIQTCLKELRDRHSPENLYLTTSVNAFLEAAHPQSNKGSAAAFLTEDILGLSAHQVMAMGDNCNDLEMLAYAGIGVAMQGGPQIVQDRADWVAPSVEEDGVAQVIHQFLL
jgi:Cof subfamily protein (haloacid dehalogenase superfamily)